MSKRDEPAFPALEYEQKDGWIAQFPKTIGGVSKLELAAMFAMQGILTNPYWDYYPEQVASDAATYARALLDELSKESSK